MSTSVDVVPVTKVAKPGLRIFVVENHPDTLLSLRMYLESLGHFVETARSVAEASEKLPQSNLQVLICDIGLPDGTGWEVAERAHLPSNVLAVAMSGFGMNADSDRSRAAGFHHHLLKPFGLDELDQILEEASSLS